MRMWKRNEEYVMRERNKHIWHTMNMVEWCVSEISRWAAGFRSILSSTP